MQHLPSCSSLALPLPFACLFPSTLHSTGELGGSLNEPMQVVKRKKRYTYWARGLITVLKGSHVSGKVLSGGEELQLQAWGNQLCGRQATLVPMCGFVAMCYEGALGPLFRHSQPDRHHLRSLWKVPFTPWSTPQSATIVVSGSLVQKAEFPVRLLVPAQLAYESHCHSHPLSPPQSRGCGSEALDQGSPSLCRCEAPLRTPVYAVDTLPRERHKQLKGCITVKRFARPSKSYPWTWQSCISLRLMPLELDNL